MAAGYFDLLVLQGIWTSLFAPPLVVKIAFSTKAADINFTAKRAKITFTKVDC